MLLLKLFFGEHGDPERLVAHLEHFRAQAVAKLATLEAIHEQPASPGEELPRMTLRQGLIGTRAQLRWAEEILPELRARAGADPNRVAATGREITRAG
jgi:hypothetical protein